MRLPQEYAVASVPSVACANTALVKCVSPGVRCCIPTRRQISERANPREIAGVLMALARVVVPAEPVVFLGLGEFMRSVTKWLVPGQTALAEIFFLAADNKLVRFMVSAFNDACHALLLCVERRKDYAAAYVSAMDDDHDSRVGQDPANADKIDDLVVLLHPID